MVIMQSTTTCCDWFTFSKPEKTELMKDPHKKLEELQALLDEDDAQMQEQ